MSYDSSTVPLVARYNSRGQLSGLRQSLDIGASSVRTTFLVPDGAVIYVSGDSSKLVAPILSATEYQGGGLVAGDAYFSALADGPGGYGSTGQFVVVSGNSVILSGSLDSLVSHLANTSNPHSTALSGLTDVSSSIRPATNQSLVWNGTLWTASSVAGSVGGGVDTFLELTDTSSTYVGAADQILVVNPQEDGINFVDISFFNHAGLSNVGTSSHTELETRSNNLQASATVHDTRITDVTTSTVEISGYIAANEASWLAGGGATDHGTLTGLLDNDHPQYVLSSTNSSLSSLVTNIQTSTVEISGYIAANEGTWATVGATDHGALTGLSDNDHPQYVLSSTNTSLSSLANNLQASATDADSRLDAIEVWEINNLGDVSTVGAAAPDNGGYLYWDSALGIWRGNGVLSAPVNEFTDLNDGPGGYAVAGEDAGKFLIVGSDGSSIEFSGSYADDFSRVDGTVPYTGNVVIGVDGGGAKSLYLYSPSSGYFTQLSTDNGNTTLETVSGTTYIKAGGQIIVESNGGGATRFVVNTAGNMFLGLDGSGNRTFTAYSTVAGYEFKFFTFGANAFVESKNGQMYFDAQSTHYFRTGYTERARITASEARFVVPVITEGYTLASGNIDNTYLSSLTTSIQTSTVDLSSYIAANEGTWSTDTNTDALSALTDVDVAAPSPGQILMWTTSSWEASTSPAGVTDHGLLTGLSDNDHPQYVLSSTNSSLSSLVTSVETSTVEISGYIAANESAWLAGGGATDHGTLTGLLDNDHPQYVLSSTNSSLSSLVTSVETSTVDLSAYIATNESTWSTDTNTTDHGALTGLTDNDHPQYVLSATNSSLSSLVTNVESSAIDLSAYIAANESTWATDTNTSDHGSLTGLSDNDHPQYVLSSTNSSLSSLVTNVQTSTVDLSSYIAANEGTWSTDTNTTDHGLLTGLSDNDHPQYVLSATNASLSSLVTSVETSTVDLSAYIAANEGTWSTDTNTTDHGALTGLADNDHPQYVLSATNSSLSSLVANVQTSTVEISGYIAANESSWSSGGVTDHGALTGLSDNDHPQYVLSATNSSLSSLVTNVQTSTVDLSAYISANESTWSTDTNTTDHGALTGLADNDHPQYVLSATNASLSSLVTNVQTSTIDLSAYIAANEEGWGAAPATPDHGTLLGLTDDDHTQYSLVNGTRAFTGRVAGLDPVGVQDFATAGWTLANFTLALNYDAHVSSVNPHGTALSSLSDASTVSPATNDGLVWDGSKWDSIPVILDTSNTVYPSALTLAIDDFNFGILGTTTNNVGTGTSYSYNIGYSAAIREVNNNCQGVLVVTNGSTTARGTAGGSRYQGDPYITFWKGIRIYYRVAISHSTDIWCRWGWSRQTVGGTSNPVSACYFEVDSSIGTEVSGGVAFSGITTTVGLGLDISSFTGSFRWFGIEYNESTNEVDFYDCGDGKYPNQSRGLTASGSISSPVPPYPGHESAMRFWYQTISNEGTNRNLLVDAHGYDYYNF